MAKDNARQQAPIDFVITWVDGSDEKWRQERSRYALMEDANETFKKWNNNDIRFRDWGTLKYLFRGIEKNADWVRNVFFVTNGQVPEWLNLNHPKLRFVRHQDFIDAKFLPTFNSNAIELNFHKIDGISEDFVYFNDDIFILRKLSPKDYFVNGKPVVPAALNCVALEMGKGHAEINNMKLLNKYFDKRKVIKTNLRLWFNPKTGIRQYSRTLLLTPWDKFPGLFDSHVESAHTVSSYKKVWELEKAELEKTCAHKFRQDSDYNHWLFKNWNLVSGNAVAKSEKSGKSYVEQINDNIITSVMKRKYKTICINDVECSEREFVREKARLTRALEEIYPEKSNYEK